MTELKNKTIIGKTLSRMPIVLLFISVLNDYDFNYLSLKYFSFNFSYILIFYYSLKKSESLGYTYIFIAGLFNDVVTGTPIGLSSLMYLVLCVAASYLRNITLRPSLIKDWFFFLFTILLINSFNYILMTLFFSLEIDYYDTLFNLIFTFLFYIIFAYIFDIYQKLMLGKQND